MTYPKPSTPPGPPPIKSKNLELCKCGCKRLFKKKKPWQLFYSSKCRDNYHNGLRIIKQNYDEEIQK